MQTELRQLKDENTKIKQENQTLQTQLKDIEEQNEQLQKEK